MADRRTRRKAGQRRPAGVGKQIEHPDGAAGGADKRIIPIPVGGLFGKDAGMLEAGRRHAQPEAAGIADDPLLRQLFAVFPPAAAAGRAMIDGMGVLPQRVRHRGLPDDLRVGAHEDIPPPPLKPVAGRSVNQLIVLPVFSCSCQVRSFPRCAAGWPTRPIRWHSCPCPRPSRGYKARCRRDAPARGRSKTAPAAVPE